MTEQPEPKGHWVSPNDMMAAATEYVGHTPTTNKDWQLVINFFAANIAPEVEPEACLFMAKLFEIPLDDDLITKIVNFQLAQAHT